ncbi:WcaI family glycosyltransferase [Fibrella aquatilis]|uniref:WcaI family glycosyltransferase n=1 Tax=Fibrella aquatilis TaxID=2817059 RepID=A0A939G9M5_9BACT|nr:WcaI family glycosyltransferase [Fibrella aquatilis]MBO0933194.1 WcaI family glycosyltransferase [Fibrella aquatilis]
MNLLIYDINYAPELTGVGKYTGEMGSWLAAQGHTVDVITAMPYYPEWRVHPAYRGRGWFTEHIDGVTVHRCPLYVPNKVTSLSRVIHEFSFQLSSFPLWLRRCFSTRYDAVICVAPPFHASLLPVLFAKLTNTPLWIHLQDLQIDMAKELGMFKNGRFIDLLFSAEARMLKQASVVSTISEGMIRKVADKRVLTETPLLFPNWVDETVIRPLPRSQSLRAEFGLSDTDKVVLYSGSLGEKQGLELIMEAARHFQQQPDVKFLIVGSGGGKTRLEALVQQLQLTNVYFHPLQPYEKLAALLATPDVHLVLQKKSASDLVLPSKLTGMLAAGGCALVSAVPDTTLYDVVSTHQMGLLIEPESAPALIAGLTHALTTDLSHYRHNARAYAQKYLSKEAILRQFEADLFHLQQRSLPLSLA